MTAVPCTTTYMANVDKLGGVQMSLGVSCADSMLGASEVPACVGMAGVQIVLGVGVQRCVGL